MKCYRYVRCLRETKRNQDFCTDLIGVEDGNILYENINFELKICVFSIGSYQIHSILHVGNSRNWEFESF